uniref:GATOR2 complex protein WDR24 n=1 Tax=Lygus hesperus TaxID=30085 RepID=A0A0A9YPZ5_LYGHE
MHKTIFIAQEGPANALALNKDYSRVVIAGRNVFKIFLIEEDEFVEFCNLRVGKNLNLNFSCNDVAWNSIDDHILATAATNGAVVVWNLNRPSRSKQEHVFIEHNRTVNKVSFNPVEPTWLISGSQDGTMRTFDLRTKTATNVFHSNTESVRDVQFNPNCHALFASVSENGNVQTWDMRKPDKCVLQFTAHSGPIFACDWHPESLWLATASRDKTIKVWDMSSSKPTMEQTINTIASVGRVKWRPQHKYHIASVALVVDCSVNVWDIRRPYIPYVAFTNHKDVATGIAWRGDPNVCLTTSRDCTLYQHVFKDATYPAAQVNPHALAVSPQGHIAFACKVTPSTVKGSKIQGILRRTTTSSEEFWQVSSTLNFLECTRNKDMNWLIQFAERYVLTGKPLGEICDHNSAVALSLGRFAVGMMWSMIKTLYAQDEEDGLNLSFPPIEEPMQSRSEETRLPKSSLKENGKSRSVESNSTDNKYRRKSNSDELEDSVGDFFFGDAEMDPLSMEFEINHLDGLITQDWTLQPEAFQLRQEIQDRSSPPEQFHDHDSPDGMEEEVSRINEKWKGLSVAETLVPKMWDEKYSVVSALKQHGTNGDVQTAVCILIALPPVRRQALLNLIDLHDQEVWLLAYISLLNQHQLFTHANEIIKLAWIPEVNQLNQQSTTVNISCNQCNKVIPQGTRLCGNCSSSVTCSVCHQVVDGAYVWCQGCMHGGHLLHMQTWLSKNTLCPAGCGHACEYT